MLADSYNDVKSVFESLGCEISRCRENRIDYCYHTNIIKNPEKIFSDKNINSHMSTTMTRWHQTGRIETDAGQVTLRKDYFALGERKSNNVFIRCYNKALEVIEEGYKGFFFEIWHKNGLISFYDKYCFEYALTHKSYDYVHKAKLYFYLEYGTDERVKQEFRLTLNDSNKELKDYKELAAQYMPEVSSIMNIEFETKRKFYYYSDTVIDGLKYIPRPDVPDALKRMYKIIDNRALFLDYLTEKTLYFNSSWWERLRNTSLDGLKPDEKLLRIYSQRLDERQAKVRFINAVATNAVYNDKVDSDFVSDISDLLSNLNDNDIQTFKMMMQGVIVSDLLDDYKTKKQIKEKRLKNRKKNVINNA